MISSVQNRQQKTAFGAYIVPKNLEKQFQGKRPKTATIKESAKGLWTVDLTTGNRIQMQTLQMDKFADYHPSVTENKELTQLIHGYKRSYINEKAALLVRMTRDAIQVTPENVNRIREAEDLAAKK